jgi:hypothetical protein
LRSLSAHQLRFVTLTIIPLALLLQKGLAAIAGFCDKAVTILP